MISTTLTAAVAATAVNAAPALTSVWNKPVLGTDEFAPIENIVSVTDGFVHYQDTTSTPGTTSICWVNVADGEGGGCHATDNGGTFARVAVAPPPYSNIVYGTAKGIVGFDRNDPTKFLFAEDLPEDSVAFVWGPQSVGISQNKPVAFGRLYTDSDVTLEMISLDDGENDEYDLGFPGVEKVSYKQSVFFENQSGSPCAVFTYQNVTETSNSTVLASVCDDLSEDFVSLPFIDQPLAPSYLQTTLDKSVALLTFASRVYLYALAGGEQPFQPWLDLQDILNSLSPKLGPQQFRVIPSKTDANVIVVLYQDPKVQKWGSFAVDIRTKLVVRTGTAAGALHDGFLSFNAQLGNDDTIFAAGGTRSGETATAGIFLLTDVSTRTDKNTTTFTATKGPQGDMAVPVQFALSDDILVTVLRKPGSPTSVSVTGYKVSGL